MRIDQKPPTRFSMDEAVSAVETLTKGEEDGWTYKVINIRNIKHGKSGEIAVYDFDGEYLGSF
jgi:hypothetical protein